MNHLNITSTQRELYPVERILHTEMGACYRKVAALYRELFDLIQIQPVQNAESALIKREHERLFNQIMMQIEDEVFKASSIFEIIMDFEEALPAAKPARTNLPRCH